MILSFFHSPFSNEEEYNAVLLRVLNNEITSVDMVKDDNIIHRFELFSISSEEKVGLFRMENDELYKAEYMAYNSNGEVVYIGNLLNRERY